MRLARASSRKSEKNCEKNAYACICHFFCVILRRILCKVLKTD